MPPFAVSSALGDDSDIMDASVLMSSDYVQPLLASELSELVLRLLDPENMQWLRHCAVKRYIKWRREHLGNSLLLHKQELHRLQTSHLATVAKHAYDGSLTSSMVSSPSGVLVPHSLAGFYREEAATPFSHTGDVSWHVDIPDLGGETAPGMKNTGLNHGRLAGWALDLQNALNSERRGRQLLPSASDKSMAVAHPGSNKELALAKTEYSRPSHMKGDTSCQTTGIDAKDPLGVLAFGQRFNRTGRTALRVLGGCGVATLAVWIWGNWSIVTGLLGFSEPDVVIPGYAFVGHAGRGSAGMSDWEWKALWWGDK